MLLVAGFYFSLFIAGWLTIDALLHRGPAGRPRVFALLGLIVAAWSVGELLILSAETPSDFRFARRAFFAGAAALPPTWLWLSVRAARPAWYVRDPRRLALAFALPVFFYSCLYWDQSVRFVAWDTPTPQHGPWFDVFNTYQYILCLVGTGYFLQSALRLRRASLVVTSSLIAGTALPIVVNFIYYFGAIETDWTVATLGPSAVFIWFAVVESGLASNQPTERHGVIDQLDVGVIVADPDGTILSANPAAERLVELGDLRGRLLPEAVAAAEQRQDAAIESRSIDLRGRFGITGHALILTDRTDAEASRRRLELGGRLEALGSLTAGIAHEVNNPLAFIQANLSALEMTAKQLRGDRILQGLAPEARESVEDMEALVEETQEGVERIRLLVQRLKTFSRTPDLEAIAVEVDLDRALGQAAAIASIGQHGDAIRFSGAPGLRILTIETALFQILVNLLLNAVQAAPQDPQVCIDVETEADGVLIRVQDEGPGINESDLPRIFDPFFTTKPTGTGLGLSLSFDLARQLGGHLSASNRDPQGATFSLWLPAVPPGISEAVPASREADTMAPAPASREPDTMEPAPVA